MGDVYDAYGLRIGPELGIEPSAELMGLLVTECSAMLGSMS